MLRTNLFAVPGTDLLILYFRSAARLRGFEEDLHLKGSQFASLLSILYIGYIMMQIPSSVSRIIVQILD